MHAERKVAADYIFVKRLKVFLFVEDKKLIRIVLPKADTGGHPCWKSLLIGQFEADAWTLEQMQKKITLERFQIEVS